MSRILTTVTLVIVAGLSSLHAATDAPTLSLRNTEAPFSYVAGATRRWPVFAGKLASDDVISLAVQRADGVAVEGNPLDVDGLSASLSTDGFLSVTAPNEFTADVALMVSIDRDGETRERQQLTLRRAPPNRPLSYVADLVDDLIRINWDASKRQFRPLAKDGFDQYFRRLQAQGITRLIVWQSPFPLIADPDNYEPNDWRRFEQQARAILDSTALNERLRSTPRLKSYQWLGMLMQLRLSRDFDQMFTQSAVEHGIKLTASFRPFEAALTKYYEVPAFDSNGRYLWGFLPGATPTVNYHPDDVSFAHYREILRGMDKSGAAQLARIEIGGLANAQVIAERAAAGESDIQIFATPVPPLDETSFVLVQGGDEFKLVPYAEVREQVESHRVALTDASIRADGARLIVDGIAAPESCRYLVVRAASEFGNDVEMPVVPDVVLRAAAGNRLGRVNVYCSLDAADEAARLTRVAGVPTTGLYHTEFQAIEASIDYFRKSGQKTWRLGDGSLVIDRGQTWSVEMTDFRRPAAREFVVRELKTILAYDAFDEIFINTRSHTQLSGATGDGVDGVQPMAHYRLNGKNYYHYGIDRAFGPISMADSPAVRSLDVEEITTWQPGEWQGPCQSLDNGLAWRYHRNRAVADGVRALLDDLEREFAGTRIRAVIPQSESVIRSTEAALQTMAKPDGGVYGSDYFRHVWGSLNHIPAIGEGMAMMDLSGTSVEPVFLGIRYAPDPGPFDAFVSRYIADHAENLGSRFNGPKSFFYEAQETLRGTKEVRAEKRQRREEIICDLLGRDAINEVLLYEAADWTYNMPLSDRELTGHMFLDRCAK